MKCRLLLISLLVSLPGYLPAQSILSVNGESIDRLFVDVTWETWLNPPSDIDFEPARNRGITFSSLFRLDGGDNKVGIAPGIGFSSANVHTNVKAWSFDDEGAIEATWQNPDYKKNKVVLSYVEVPLEVQYRAKDKHESFKAALGIKGGWLVDLHTKRKKDNGDKIKQKFRDPFQDYRYGTYLRIGYGSFHVFGHLGLSSIFEPDQAPNTQSLSVGISLSGI